MDTASLRAAVESAVQLKCANNVPFTGLCISKPIIEQHPELRHKRDIKPMIDEMWANGIMVGTDEDGVSETPYTRSMVDVAGGKYQAWLYHNPNFDPADFNETNLSLSRKKNDDKQITVKRNIDFDSEDDGSPFEVSCQSQYRRRTLNIPRSIIKKLNWKNGDRLLVMANAYPYSFKISRVRQSQPYNQIVDKENRIRLHGIHSGLSAKVSIKNKEILICS